MKKIFLALLAFAALQADMTVVGKVVPTESRGYFVFSDGTYWKVSSFIKRWRTPVEWIMGDEIYVPENYDCLVSNWTLGDTFEAYPKYGNARVNESDASNEEAIKNHTHILVNPRTEKILFGTPIHPADFMVQVYNEGYNEGYSVGYGAGHSAGYSLGHSVGFTDGKASVEKPK